MLEIYNSKQTSSQVLADKRRDERTDVIKFRVPVGMREKIKNYVVTLPDYQRILKGKTEPNVNQWLLDLVNSALPIDW